MTLNLPAAGAGPVALKGFRVSSATVWWLLVTVIVGVVGWMKTINVLLLVSYTLATLWGINAFLAYRMTRRLTARRLPRPPAFAGEEIVLRAEIVNPTDQTKSVTVLESPSLDVATTWFLPHFQGGTYVPASSKVVFANRGRQSLPILMVRSGYPFGLVSFQRPLTSLGEQWVLPPLGIVNARLMKRFLIRAGHGDGRSRRPPARNMPSEGDVRGVRPHRQGDGARDIHWKTSARRGEWMVREYDRTAPLDLVIFVDPWVPSTPTDRHSRRKLDWALSLAISAAWAWVHEDQPGTVTVVVFDETVALRSGPGTPQFVREGFCILAGVVGTPAVSVSGMPALRNRAARLLVSTRPRSPVAAAVRSAGVSLAVVDPGSSAPWFAPPAAVGLDPAPETRGAR